MTVPYTSEVATSTFGCFVKLLFRWRGSIYKLIWKDFVVYIILHYIVRIVYRNALSEKGQRNFESLSKYSETYVSVIPLSFVLGFYVQQVVARWHLQFDTIPFPDSTAVLVTANVKGLDERGRLIRRTMMRYLMLGYVMTMRSIAPLVKKRFPTMKHLTEAGLMSPQEEKILDNIKVNFNKYSIPFIWATSLVSLARKEGRIYDDYAVAVLNDVFNQVRQKLNQLFLFDWVGIPLVYTQVVTLSVYLYFVLTLFSQQFLIRRDGIVGKDVDLIVPVAAILQFFFYMGWLKVAETLINPFGEDDDDFEINGYIDRNMQLAYLAVDGIHADHPPLVKDMYWDTQLFELPYTEATFVLRKKSDMQEKQVEAGSAARVTVPDSKSGFVHAEASLQDTAQKAGRKPTETSVRMTINPVKLENEGGSDELNVMVEPKMTDKSESTHALKVMENVPKQEIPGETGTAQDDEGTPPLRVSSHRSLHVDEDEGNKALKVIDLPISKQAVRTQRQQSLIHHIDRVQQSLAFDGEETSSMTDVRLARSVAPAATDSSRRLHVGTEEPKPSDTPPPTPIKKRLPSNYGL